MGALLPDDVIAIFFGSDSSSGGGYLGVHMTSKLIRLESHDDQNVGNEPEDL